MTTAAPNSIQIDVQIGEGYSPTPRIAAALAELRDALEEAGGGDADEVAGFALEFKDVYISSAVAKGESSWKAPQPMGFSWGVSNAGNTTNYSFGANQTGTS